MTLARERQLDLRTSSYIIAISRVGRAAVLQGVSEGMAANIEVHDLRDGIDLLGDFHHRSGH